MNPSLIIAAIVASLVVAIALLRRGWIGRVVDDHPICRACAFDLFNLPTSTNRCPECGADLTARRATRIGNRQRRAGLFRGGMVLLLGTLIVAGVAGTRWMRTVNWYAQWPDFWIERDTRHSSLPQQKLAWAELKRRYLDNAVSSTRSQRLVDVVLARQADEQSKWLDEMGDFLEAAHRAKALPREKWLRYARQAPLFRAMARKQIRRGDPIVVEIHERGYRVASPSLLVIRPIDALATGDFILPRNAPERFENFLPEEMSTGGYAFTLLPDKDVAGMESAPLGEHAVKVTSNYEVLEGDELDPQNQRSLIKGSCTLSATYQLVSRDVSTVEIIADTDPALRKKVKASFNVETGLVYKGFPKEVFLRYGIIRAPVPLAYRVTVRQGKTESTSKMQVNANRGTSTFLRFPTEQFPGDRVDVVFESDINAVLESVDGDKMWNGRLEFKDIPIKRNVPIGGK